MPIDEGTYLKLVSAYTGTDIVHDLPGVLVPLWCDDYAAGNPVAELVEVTTAEPGGPPFSYLFDLIPQRNIVAWGVPSYVSHGRDAARMRGHPLGGDSRYHRGHLMSHGTGGGTDINLVPQLGSLNIGAFRRLERMVRDLAQQHQTCLYFVRTVYGDATSQMPSQIEQCVVQPSKIVSYAIHANS
jgi:DNA/RNA non-specific endonuclease